MAGKRKPGHGARARVTWRGGPRPRWQADASVSGPAIAATAGLVSAILLSTAVLVLAGRRRRPHALPPRLPPPH